MTLIEYFALDNIQLESLLTSAISDGLLSEECKTAIIAQRDSVKANLASQYTDEDLPDWVKNV